jgi:YegS/Rv2252/BmrU family lipid kinase
MVVQAINKSRIEGDSNKIAVILNASAGSGCTRNFADGLVEKFAACGLNAGVTLAENGHALVAAAQQAVCDGVAMVVAGGGDGTLNAVASELVGTGIVFGVLPLGTLNHFAKDLGIPLNTDEAIRTIASGHCISVDTGEVNERVFLNNSSLGLYPDTVRRRELQQSRLGRGKWLAFFWAAVTSLRRYPFLNLTLTVDDQTFQKRTLFVFIGNNDYVMEGFNIGARTALDAGRLSLYVAHRTSRLGLLVLALRAVFGRLRQAVDFDVLSAKSLVIESRHKQLRVATDGEVNLMHTPLSYRIVPKSLNVLVPAAGQSRSG